jgi:hypothetical protein
MHDSIVTLTEHDTSWSGESDEQPQAATTEQPNAERQSPNADQDAEAAAAEEEHPAGQASPAGPGEEGDAEV